MKIDRIAFEQLYPTGVYANQRYRVEILIEDSDKFIGEEKATYDAFAKAKDLVEKTFIALNPQIKWEEPPLQETPIQKDSKESVTERMITAINACTEIKVLETFKLLVKNNPVFQEAYDNKLKSLQ